MADYGIICQSCGIEAPSKHVAFYQNIGMLVARRYSSVKGNLCKNCVHKHFWKMTTVNLTVGWLGQISVFVAPCYIINNVFRYMFALGMKGVPRGAKVPVLTEDAALKLAPFAGEIVAGINGDRKLADVARAVAPRAGVTPGQVVRFVIALADQARPTPPQKPTYGFPVQPVPTMPVRAIPVTPVPVQPY